MACVFAGSYATMQVGSPPKAYPLGLACAMLQALYVLVKELQSTHTATADCNGRIKHHQQALAGVLAAGLKQHDPQVVKLEAGLDKFKEISRKMVKGIKQVMVPSIGESQAATLCIR